MLDSLPLLFPSDFPAIDRRRLQTLQINLGYRCNQSCRHCHVDAGPKRSESMSEETVAAVLAFLDRHPVRTLDITGGAPEMHPEFRRLDGGHASPHRTPKIRHHAPWPTACHVQ